MNRDAWNARYAGRELVWTAEANRFVKEELADLPPGRALDLAAGEGRNAVWLADRGWAVRAVDFSSVALEKARRLAAARGVEIETVEADLDHYEPELGAFDLVLLAYVQFPWARMVPVLHRAAAAVAPSGTFFLVAHDETNLDHGYGGPKDRAVLYGPEAVAGELRDLDILRAERVERPVETEAGPRVAIDCLVRAVRPGSGPAGP